MLAWFDRMLGRAPARGTRNQAKERLQLILVHDRLQLPPERLEAMKEEILAVIAKYIAINDDEVKIALQPRDRGSILVASIPFEKTTPDIEQPLPEYNLLETDSDDSSDVTQDLIEQEKYQREAADTADDEVDDTAD